MDRASDGCGKTERKRAEPPPPPPPPPPPSPPTCGGADAKSLFEVLSASDRDGNGTLSSCEIGKTAAAGLMSDVFGKIDSDGDGQLNAGEVDAYESAVNEVLTAMGSEAGIAEIVEKAGEGADDGAPAVEQGHHHHGHHHGHERADAAQQGHHGHRGEGGGIRMDEATATVVADALVGVLDAMDADRDGTLTACELKEAVEPEAAPNGAATAGGTSSSGGTATPATPAPATPAPSGPPQADADSTDTGGSGAGSAAPRSLSASIFAALARQIGESDDTTELAHQYTNVLHALRG